MKPLPTADALDRFARRHTYRLCWQCAEAVVLKFGGRIRGYFCADNPTAVAGKSSGGHEFAFVADRWIVDAWTPFVEGLPIPPVLDLNAPEGQEYAAAYYGERWRWDDVDWKARRRERIRTHGRKYEAVEAMPVELTEVTP